MRDFIEVCKVLGKYLVLGWIVFILCFLGAAYAEWFITQIGGQP
jgi:hypothetical protein